MTIQIIPVLQMPQEKTVPDEKSESHAEDVAKGVEAALDARDKKKSKRKRNRGLVIATVVIAAMVYCSQQMKDPTVSVPQLQREFCAITVATRNDFRAGVEEKNALKARRLQTEARAQRKSQIAALLPDRTVTGWRGTMDGISLGAAVLGIETSANIGIGCGATMRADLNSPELLRFFEETPVGGNLVVDGRFLPSTGDDPFREYSLTEYGGMTEPEFGFVITSVERQR